MNYRHIYHAGNFGDVVKHVVLLAVLDHLKKKDKAFGYLDTHAGTGWYDLADEAAEKTGDALSGIGKLWSQPGLSPEVEAYIRLVKRVDTALKKAAGAPDSPELRFYPGSPFVAREAMRAQDRLVLTELHPEDAVTLKQRLRDEQRAHVHHMDGYTAVRAHLPPPERRGVVLMDPPFERDDELEAMARGLEEAHGRWSSGIFALWYRIKEEREIRQFWTELRTTGIRRILDLTFMVREPADVTKLNGCGVIVVNPPFQLEETLERIMPPLADLLRLGPGAAAKVTWVVEE